MQYEPGSGNGCPGEELGTYQNIKKKPQADSTNKHLNSVTSQRKIDRGCFLIPRMKNPITTLKYN